MIQEKIRKDAYGHTEKDAVDPMSMDYYVAQLEMLKKFTKYPVDLEIIQDILGRLKTYDALYNFDGDPNKILSYILCGTQTEGETK